MTSAVEFKASVKHFLKLYASKLRSAKPLVLLLNYCLSVSFGRGINRTTNLNIKWSKLSTDYGNCFKYSSIPVVCLGSLLYGYYDA